MPQLLLILGAILALVGLGSIAAGAPDWLLGLSLGATLIQSGTIAFVGGLVIVGLGLVLYVMQDLLRRVEALSQGAAPTARPAMLPPGEQPAAGRQPPSAGARQQPQPDAGRVREPAPLAAEPPAAREGAGGEPPRVRRERREPPPEFPGDDAFGEQARPPRRERPRDAHSEEAPRPREARAEEVAQPRRPAPPQMPEDDETPPQRRPAAAVYPEEEGARPRQRQRSEPGHEDAPRFRPERPREQPEEGPARQRRDFAPIPSIPQPFGGEGRRAPEPGRESAEPPAPKFRPAESAPGRPGSDTVVRSGVIGGMAYTLYVDGSIEAELPIGTVRFNSIAELQDHVLRTGAEADGDFDDQQR